MSPGTWLSRSTTLGTHCVEGVEIGAPERELVLRPALAGAGADVLGGEERDVEALDAGKRAAQAVGDALGGEPAALATAA